MVLYFISVNVTDDSPGLMVSEISGKLNVTSPTVTQHIPEDIEAHAVIAIGYQGEKEALSEAMQEREKPSSRRELSETVFEGVFAKK